MLELLRHDGWRAADGGAPVDSGFYEGVLKMLAWALVFFIIALIAGLFGFEIIETGAANVALILFFVFLVLFLISLIVGYRRRPTV